MEARHLRQVHRSQQKEPLRTNLLIQKNKRSNVAPAMAFLLSEEARFITGVTLPVTGGSAIV